MWAETVVSVSDRVDAVTQVALVWAATDPASAARYATTLRKDGKHDDSVLSGVIRIWASKDPNAAASFVLTLPPALITNTIIYYIVSALGRTNLSAAEDFGRKLPTSDLRYSADWYLKDVKKQVAPAR